MDNPSCTDLDQLAVINVSKNLSSVPLADDGEVVGSP